MLEGEEGEQEKAPAPAAKVGVNLIDPILCKFLRLKEPLLVTLVLIAPKRTLLSLLSI